jgi:hypothetical protein
MEASNITNIVASNLNVSVVCVYVVCTVWRHRNDYTILYVVSLYVLRYIAFLPAT